MVVLSSPEQSQISQLEALGQLIQDSIATIKESHQQAGVPLPTVSPLQSINPKADQAARNLSGDRLVSNAISTLIASCHQLSASVQS